MNDDARSDSSDRTQAEYQDLKNERASAKRVKVERKIIEREGETEKSTEVTISTDSVISVTEEVLKSYRAWFLILLVVSIWAIGPTIIRSAFDVIISLL